MEAIKYVNALGIDIGEKRIGLARVGYVAKIPEPLGTLINNDSFKDTLNKYITNHQIDLIVVGLPRNLKGEETPQTQYVRQFAQDKIISCVSLPVVFQDETLSSVSAEQNNSKSEIKKHGLDSLAAVEILSDYIGRES